MAADPAELERSLQERIDTLNSVIDAYEGNAYGSDTDGGELARQRGLAIDAYQGKHTKIDPVPDGRVEVGEWTVFETIHQILPSLIRIFASGDNVVEFQPFGPEDEDAAEQESEFLNYLVTQKNNWFLTCLTWFQDALLTKNAYCMAFIEEVLHTEVETYEGQSEEQVSLILDDDVEVIGQNVREDTEAEPQPVIDPLTGQPAIDELGQPVLQPPPPIFDIQIRRTQAKKQLKFKVLPPERCKVDENCTDFTLDECDYFEYWDFISISDLRKMGHDVPLDIADDPETETEEDTSRDEMFGKDIRDGGLNPDETVRRVKARWVWVRHDFDGDGIAELQHVLRVGRRIFEREDVSTIPVASVVPFINTHRHIGNSIADLVYEIQRIKTAILRQGLDNLYLANNPREFHGNKVNIDDLLLSRPGAKIAVNSDAPDIAGHVHVSPYPNVFPQAQEGLRHMDTVVEARVGANRLFQGIDESNLNDHNRIGQLSTMAAQRIEQIARILGNGVERLFKIAHELVIKSGHQGDTIKLRGQWVTFDPKQWRTGRDMRVVAPYAAGNKDSLLQRLMVVGDIQERIVQGGGRSVQEDDVYNLAQEVAKATDFPPDRFFTDPQTVPPPEPPPDYNAAIIQNEATKTQNEAIDEARSAELEELKIQKDSEDKRFVAELMAEKDILLAQIKQGGSEGIEKLRAKLRDQPVQLANESITETGDAVRQFGEQMSQAIAALNDALSELRADFEAPIEVVRDENGRIAGRRNTRTGQVQELRGV